MNMTMNVISEDIQHMIKDRLKEEGYKGLIDDIRFSLGHCQGDGIAFYGSVTKTLIDDMIQEIEHLNYIVDYAKDYLGITEKKLKQYRIIYTVKKDKRFHLYDHYNTMIVKPGDFDDVGYIAGLITDDMLARWEDGETMFEILNRFFPDKVEAGEIAEYIDIEGFEGNKSRYLSNSFYHEIMDFQDNNTHEYIQEDLSNLSKELEKEAYKYIE